MCIRTTKEKTERSMSSRSTSPSVSSEDDSDLSFFHVEDGTEDSGEEICPYDESLETVATEEEVATYEESSAREAEQEEEYERHFHGEVDANTWYVFVKQP